MVHVYNLIFRINSALFSSLTSYFIHQEKYPSSYFRHCLQLQCSEKYESAGYALKSISGITEQFLPKRNFK